MSGQERGHGPDDVVGTKCQRVPRTPEKLYPADTTTNLPPIARKATQTFWSKMTNFENNKLANISRARKTGAELQNRREGRRTGMDIKGLPTVRPLLECGLPNASVAADTEWPATSTSLNEPAK